MSNLQEAVTTAAAEIIADKGLINLTRESVCKRAGIASGSFTLVMGCTFTEFLKNYEDENLGDVTEHTRSDPRTRRAQILKVATAVAKRIGINNMRRADVAEQAGVSGSLVSRYFASFDDLREEVATGAIESNDGRIMAQLILADSPLAGELSDEQREIAARSVATR